MYSLKMFILKDVMATKSTSCDVLSRSPYFVSRSRMSPSSITNLGTGSYIPSSSSSSTLSVSTVRLIDLFSRHTTSLSSPSTSDRWLSNTLFAVYLWFTPVLGRFPLLLPTHCITLHNTYSSSQPSVIDILQ